MATADYTILGKNEATWIPTNDESTLSDIYLASNDIALLSDWSVSTSLASDDQPILITINSPRLMGFGEPTSTSRKQTGYVMLKSATHTLLKLAKQELSNKPRIPSGKQRIRPVASSFRPAAFDNSNQPCRHQPNRSAMNETKNVVKMLNDLDKQIQKVVVVEDKQTKWQSAVDKCDHRTGLSHIWQLVKDQIGNKLYY